MTSLTCIWATRNQSLKRCHGSVRVFWHVKSISHPEGHHRFSPRWQYRNNSSMWTFRFTFRWGLYQQDQGLWQQVWCLNLQCWNWWCTFSKNRSRPRITFCSKSFESFCIVEWPDFWFEAMTFFFFSNLSFVFWLSLNIMKWHIIIHQIAMACSVRLVGRLYFSPHTKNQERRGEGRPSRCFCNLICSSRCRSWSLRFDLGEEAACHSNGSKSKSTLPWATRWHYIATYILYIYVMQSYWTGSLNYSIHIERIKQCNLHRNLDGFALISALFQLVSYDDPCKK